MRDKLDERVERALRGAALWDEVKDRLKSSALGLSGGQQQRLCIARAIAIEPDVLLLDEPASALDPIATASIEDLIHELKTRYSIVIVTHNMQQAARVADRTAFFSLDEERVGTLIEYDDTGKLFSKPERQPHPRLHHRPVRLIGRSDGQPLGAQRLAGSGALRLPLNSERAAQVRGRRPRPRPENSEGRGLQAAPLNTPIVGGSVSLAYRSVTVLPELGWSVVDVTVTLVTNGDDFANSAAPADVSFRLAMPFAPLATENVPEATEIVRWPFLAVSAIVPAARSTLWSAITRSALWRATAPVRQRRSSRAAES